MEHMGRRATPQRVYMSRVSKHNALSNDCGHLSFESMHSSMRLLYCPVCWVSALTILWLVFAACATVHLVSTSSTPTAPSAPISLDNQMANSRLIVLLQATLGHWTMKLSATLEIIQRIFIATIGSVYKLDYSCKLILSIISKLASMSS